MSEFEIRWQAARKMWEIGYTKAQIAEVYEVSEKALKTRIQKWRKERGWFPVKEVINRSFRQGKITFDER